MGGRNISNYVDHTVLVSDTAEGLHRFVTAAKIDSEKAGLDMNVKKTKTMVISKYQEDDIKASIQINNETLEQANTFKYIGRTIIQDGKHKFEKKIRPAVAQNRFQQIRHLLT